MKPLVVLSAIVSVVFAAYPKVQTWSVPSIYFAVSPYLDLFAITPDFKRCLEATYDLAEEVYDPVDNVSYQPPKTGVVIPSPSGSVNWTVRELINVMDIVAKYEGYEAEIKDYVDINKSTYWTTDILTELMFPTGMYDATQITNDHRETLDIVSSILITMLYIKDNIKKYDLKKDTFRVIMPAVDISIWSLSELNEALSKPERHPALIPYLQKARKNELQHLREEKKYCVITPVGIVPQQEPSFRLPDGMKRLLQMGNKKQKHHIKIIA